MEPLYLELINFMGHSESKIDFTEFNSALIFAKGKSNDGKSNGAGKSTLFKAIEFALFGMYHTKTIDKIVKEGTDFCKVIFDFKLDKEYRIIRSRNKKTGKSDLSLLKKDNGSFINLDQKTNSEMEKELAKLIKINYETFKNSNLFSQDDLKSLASAKSPQERRAIFKEILNLSIYSKYEKQAKEELTKVNNALIKQKALMEALGDPSSDLTKINLEIKNINAIIDADNYKLNEFILEAENKNFEISKLEKMNNSEFSELKANIKNLEDKNNSLNKELTSLNEVLSLKNKELNLLINKISSLNKELSSIFIEEIDNSKIQILENDIIEIQNAGSKQTQIKIAASNKISLLNENKIPDGTLCNSCKQEISSEHKEKCLKELNDQIKENEIIIEQCNSELKRLKELHLEKNKEVTSIKNKQEQYLSNLNLKSSKENELNLSNKYKNSIDEIINKNKESIKIIEENININTNNILNLKEKLSSINIEDNSSKLEKLKYETKVLDKIIKEFSALIENNENNLLLLLEKQKTRTADYKKYKVLAQKIVELEKDYYIMQLITIAFSSKGIPTMIIYSILDDLQIEANKILSDLKSNLQLQFLISKNNSDGDLEETLDISYFLNRIELDYEMLSGGQKFVIALAIRLGLTFVLQNRLGVNMKFLQLDEVDEKLDDISVDALADFLKKLQKQFKILIITHNKYLKDKFSHTILVEYDEKNHDSKARVVSGLY